MFILQSGNRSEWFMSQKKSTRARTLPAGEREKESSRNQLAAALREQNGVKRRPAEEKTRGSGASPPPLLPEVESWIKSCTSGAKRTLTKSFVKDEQNRPELLLAVR
jgi:hypothetical protein